MAKKDKKKGKQQDDYWETEFQEDAAAMGGTNANEEPKAIGTSNAAEAKADPAMDDLAENFGGLMAAIQKSKGGKKGKKQQVDMVDANEELENMGESATIVDASPASRVEPPSSPPQQAEEEGGEFRMKTKKEKEKEKKEKEKAKKKAQVCPPV